MKKTRFAKQDLILLGLFLVLGAAACVVLLIVPVKMFFNRNH